MNEHIKLAIQALETRRGDEAERFVAKFGTPERGPKYREALPVSWWDAPAGWNPGMSPRETLESMRAFQKRHDDAIAYLRGLREQH